jgi:hypothetical protein
LLVQVAAELIVEIMDELRAWRGRLRMVGAEVDRGAHGVGVGAVSPEGRGPTVVH